MLKGFVLALTLLALVVGAVIAVIDVSAALDRLAGKAVWHR